ncbi:MAG: molybdenum cofactor biosynthesis protein [Thermoplasmata archaeon HGW-Thermoplasmata-1]|nr:MAG: molybdenum cofactor biosynthesis protein [Thermoplasmata archaeon HGW-Thermoplasmata-1]
MRPFRGLIPLEEAVPLVMRRIEPIERTEDVPLGKAVGRIVAKGVTADFDVPGFERAAMDGYAVIASDTYGSGQSAPANLKLSGRIYAGGNASFAIEKGCCSQVATGAKLPLCADAVVKVEETETEGVVVSIFKPVYPGQNVSDSKSDMAKGTEALLECDSLSPAKVGVLAALGRSSVSVYGKPRVAIIPTGDEIAKVGSELREGQVYDINSHSLEALVNEAGGEAAVWPITKDDHGTLRQAIADAARDCDMVVLSGGSSVGDRDLLHDLVCELGELVFHGVQIKPGKPTLFGIVNGRPLFGMPGYPTSCLTNGYLFLYPAIKKMARLEPERFRTESAKLSRRVVSTLGRHQIMTVRVERPECGVVAHPVFKESGAITSMAHSDGYIEIPANVDLLEEGDIVKVRLW